MHSPYEAIKSAERSITLNEQKEHVETTIQGIDTLLQEYGKETIPSLSEIRKNLSKLEELLSHAKKSLTISPDLISSIKTLSLSPKVQRLITDKPSERRNNRTLFDFV